MRAHCASNNTSNSPEIVWRLGDKADYHCICKKITPTACGFFLRLPAPVVQWWKKSVLLGHNSSRVEQWWGVNSRERVKQYAGKWFGRGGGGTCKCQRLRRGGGSTDFGGFCLWEEFRFRNVLGRIWVNRHRKSTLSRVLIAVSWLGNKEGPF